MNSSRSGFLGAVAALQKAHDAAAAVQTEKFRQAFGECAKLDSHRVVVQGKDGSVWEIIAHKHYFSVYEVLAPEQAK